MSAVLVLVEMAGVAPDRLSAEALGFGADLAGRLGGGVEAVVVAGGSGGSNLSIRYRKDY